MRNRDRMNKMKDIHSMRRIDRKIAGSNPDTEIWACAAFQVSYFIINALLFE